MQDGFKDKISKWLKAKYEIGESSGGSGHLGSTSLAILEVTQLGGVDNIVLQVIYEISTVTEFTYYPDNPPRYTMYSRRFDFTLQGKLSHVHEAEVLESNMDRDILYFDDSDLD